MRKKQGPSKKALVKAVVKMAGKASELGWSPGLPADEVQKAIKEPKFVYVKLDRVWGPWKRRGDGNNGGFVLTWGAEKIGFGELTFCILKDGTVVCDTECMGGERWTKAVMAEFLKNLSYDPRYDPPRKPL